MATPAAALPPDVALSAQLAYAAPFGDLSGDTYYVSHAYVAKAPLRLRAGWRPASVIELGASVTLAVVAVNDALTEERALVSGNALGAGLDVELHPLRRKQFDAWIGLGVGVSTLSGRFNEGRVRERWTGFLLSRIELGASTALTDRLSLGPYAGFEVGRFTRYSMSSGDASASYRIPNTSLHDWAELGLRISITGGPL